MYTQQEKEESVYMSPWMHLEGSFLLEMYSVLCWHKHTHVCIITQRPGPILSPKCQLRGETHSYLKTLQGQINCFCLSGANEQKHKYTHVYTLMLKHSLISFIQSHHHTYKVTSAES